MKHLKTFVIFESSSGLTKEQEKFLDRHTKGTWKLNPNGLVDVHGDFDCSRGRMSNFNGIRFGRVGGDFNCYSNSLTTLEGAPQTVGGDFYCSNNDLATLEGAPQTVGGDFKCSYNDLTTLVGAPQKVGGDFSCYNNSLTTLVGAPQKVGGDFYCYNNSLTTLEGAPQKVGGDFYCNRNGLTTLVGAPQTVEGGFYCDINSLTTLEGAPQTVGGDFYCDGNSLTTLEGAPRTVGGEFSSNLVVVPKGLWSTQALSEMYKNSEGRRKDLLGTLVSPEALQKRIDENPERAAVELKSIAGLPEYKFLKWPDGLKGEADLLSDLDRIGL